jgi:multidrug resistance efflux pump
MAQTLGKRRNRFATIAKGTRTCAVLTAALADDQAVIDAAKLNLEFTTVKAPTAGRVDLRQIKP